MNSENIKTSQICAKEIEVVLKKHKCKMEVSFTKESVLGQAVIKYSIVIVENEKDEVKC